MLDVSGRNLLIADDEKDLVEIYSECFSAIGFKTFTAFNGTEGAKIARNEKIDIVLSDLRMPGGDGFVLLDDYKSQNPNSPFVFVSGYTETMAYDQCMAWGAEAIVAKPIALPVLQKKVTQTLMPKDILLSQKPERAAHQQLQLQLGQFSTVHSRQVNLGRGGMFVHLPATQVPKINEIVAFDITYSAGHLRAVSGVGVVRWRRTSEKDGQRTGCGIEFTHLADDCRKQVLDYLANQWIIPYIPAD